MTHVEKVQALLSQQLQPEEVGQWHSLAMKLAVLVDYYEAIGREPESIWDRDFRAIAATIPFDPDGDDGEDCRLLEMVAGITNRMQDIRSRRRRNS